MTRQKTVGKTLKMTSILIILILLSGCIGVKKDETGSDENPESVNPESVGYKNPESKIQNNVVLKKVGNTVINITIDRNDTVAPSPVSYLTGDRGENWINFSWENPVDIDYSHAVIFIDGNFRTNLSYTVNNYNLTGLNSEKQYRIGIRTVDYNNNINPEWVNISLTTLPGYVDLMPPDTIWYLEHTAGSNWINWTWENPSDSDYSYANVWVDGMFAENVSTPKSYYRKEGFAPYSKHYISVRTVDSNKNINLKSVNGNATTYTTGSASEDISPPGPITEIKYEADTTRIKWWWTNPVDPDYSYANVYFDGTFAANVTTPANFYQKTGLLPGTEHNISVRTVDTSGNIRPFGEYDSRFTLS